MTGPVQGWPALLPPFIRLAFTLLASILLLSGCRPVPLQEQQAFVFGTRVEVIVADAEAAKAKQAIAIVLQEFDRLHRQFHAWQPSELTTLNTAIAAGQAQLVSRELADLIHEAQALAAQGDYLFDPGIGRLIALWGFQSDEFKSELPDSAALQTWQENRPSLADIRLEGQTVHSRQRGVALDFGGYLKGVALDRAASLLRSQGIQHALINIGGNILALGNKQGRPWRVGIQHPRQSGPLATLELADGEAIGTSGDYQRYFEYAGERYPHLLDPRNARPAQHTQALTIVVPAGDKAGTRSDALSKPLFIAGPQAWQTLARQLQIRQVLRVDREGKIQVTAPLHRRLHFVVPTEGMDILPVP